MRAGHFLTALGLNAVPAWGWFVEDWSAGTTLLIYWIETLLGTLLVAGRILLHRRRVPSQGHWNYRAPQSGGKRFGPYGSYLTAFLVPTLVFTCAHGFFLAVLGGVMIAKHLTPGARIEPHFLRAGLLVVALCQGVDFLLDVVRLGERPFRWVERLGQQTLGRVAIIHLSIIGGMGLVVFTGANRHIFGVFIFLKALINVASSLPQYNPKTPPAWLCNLMNRIKSRDGKDDGMTFAEFCVQGDEAERDRLKRNDEPMGAPDTNFRNLI